MPTRAPSGRQLGHRGQPCLAGVRGGRLGRQVELPHRATQPRRGDGEAGLRLQAGGGKVRYPVARTPCPSPQAHAGATHASVWRFVGGRAQAHVQRPICMQQLTAAAAGVRRQAAHHGRLAPFEQECTSAACAPACHSRQISASLSIFLASKKPQKSSMTASSPLQYQAVQAVLGKTPACGGRGRAGMPGKQQQQCTIHPTAAQAQAPSACIAHLIMGRRLSSSASANCLPVMLRTRCIWRQQQQQGRRNRGWLTRQEGTRRPQAGGGLPLPQSPCSCAGPDRVPTVGSLSAHVPPTHTTHTHTHTQEAHLQHFCEGPVLKGT